MIKIQEEDFNIEDEIHRIKLKHLNVGAVSTFIGYVRSLNNQQKVTSINLEVYKEMAHKSLEDICSQAQEKWSIIDVLIIHRCILYGMNGKQVREIYLYLTMKAM